MNLNRSQQRARRMRSPPISPSARSVKISLSFSLSPAARIWAVARSHRKLLPPVHGEADGDEEQKPWGRSDGRRRRGQ